MPRVGFEPTIWAFERKKSSCLRPRGQCNRHIPAWLWFKHSDVMLCLVVWNNIKKNSGASVRQRTIPTERPPFVGEVSANFSGQRVSRGQRNESPRPLISVF
jgi:hypothetical protein